MRLRNKDRMDDLQFELDHLVDRVMSLEDRIYALERKEKKSEKSNL